MEYPSAARERKARSISTGVVLGLGLGGFADGIALHQIAQWHNMGSAKVPPITMEAMKQNMAWDGWFHVVTLIITIVGVYLLLGHAPARPPTARWSIVHWPTLNRMGRVQSGGGARGSPSP